MKNFNTQKLVKTGVIAGLYVALSLITFSFNSGIIQFRVGEGLCLLALLVPESVIGVFVGCVITNIICGCVVLDVVLGGLITLVAGIFTYFVGKLIKNFPLKVFVGGLFPVLFNAFLLPLIWLKAYGAGEYVYIIQALFLLCSESLSIYVAGVPLLIALKKRKSRFN